MTAQTLEEAWDDGYEAGNKDVRAVNALWPELTPNPYRQKDEA